MKICNFLLQHIFVSAQLECLNDFAHLFNLIDSFRTVFPSLVFLHENNFTTFLSHFQDIESILFFNFHHGPSKLNSFIEVFKNLFFDAFYVLFLINSSTVGANAISGNRIFAMPTLNSWQFILIFVVLSILKPSILAKSNLKFFNLPMKIIDNIFILTDMQSHQFLVGDSLGLDIFSSVCIFKRVDSLLELTA